MVCYEQVACRRPDVRRGLVHQQLAGLHSEMAAHAHPFGVAVQLSVASMMGRVLQVTKQTHPVTQQTQTVTRQTQTVR